jgi:hypothetical protein
VDGFEEWVLEVLHRVRHELGVCAQHALHLLAVRIVRDPHFDLLHMHMQKP